MVAASSVPVVEVAEDRLVGLRARLVGLEASTWGQGSPLRLLVREIRDLHVTLQMPGFLFPRTADGRSSLIPRPAVALLGGDAHGRVPGGSPTGSPTCCPKAHLARRTRGRWR